MTWKWLRIAWGGMARGSLKNGPYVPRVMRSCQNPGSLIGYGEVYSRGTPRRSPMLLLGAAVERQRAASGLRQTDGTIWARETDSLASSRPELPRRSERGRPPGAGQ